MSKIALTGHREERLSNLGSEMEITKWIEKQLIDNECTDVYCGMANGADIMFGNLVCNMNHESHCKIKLHCVLPCKNYNQSNPYYETIKESSDTFEYLSEEFYKGCDNARDKKMIDECDILLAVWDGIKAGGVWSTIRKAQKAGKTIIFYSK